MNPGLIVQALRRERAEIVLRWLGQFTVSRAAAGHPEVELRESLILGLLGDIIAMVDPAKMESATSQPHHAEALADLAEFPDTIAVTIDLLQAGIQVIGAFAVENAGPWAAWSVRDRNRFLGELDAVFPLLVRREVAALCEHFLAPPSSAVPSPEMLGLPQWARDIAHRN